MRATSVLGLLLLLVAPARAGSIEVLVRERDGAFVPNQQVDLVRVEPEIDREAPRLFRPAIARAVTDARGRALFEGIAPGSYTAAPRSISNAALYFAEASNPMRSVGATTLENAGDRGSLEIVLDRGTFVSFETIFEGTPFPKGMTVSVTTPGSAAARVVLDDRGRGSTQLREGTYTFVLEYPPGLLLSRAEVDGAPVDPLHVAFDVVTPSSARQVLFALEASCKVLGTVTSTAGRPGVVVEATRADSVPGIARIVASLDEHGGYVLFLRDGAWSIRPVGERLLDSVPAETRLALAPGQEGRADFSVREREPGDEARLMVAVLDPDGRGVAGARVEAWPASDLHPAGEPAAEARTEPWGGAAALTGLPAGGYRIVAGAPGYAGGSVVLADYAPGRSDRRIELRLARGASIRARAVDDSGAPVEGVVLRLATSEVPEVDGFSSEDSAVCAAARSHVSPSDREGGVVVRGLAPGTWSATADSVDASTVVELAAPGEPRAREASFDLSAGETVEIELRVVPAASLSASLRCSDRGPIPARAAARLFEGSEEEPVLERTVDLDGEKRDHLTLGPLQPGDYRFAVRPESFDGWTFAPGAPIAVAKGETSDAGTLVLRCEPAVELALSVRSGQPLPSLGRAEVRATWVSDAPAPIPSEIDGSRVVFQPVPPGTGRLDVSLRHPCFLPGGEVRGSFPLTLERGRIAPAALAVPSVGGAVVARGGVAARIRPAGGEATIAAAERDGVTFAALAPGAYAVDVCADPACAGVVRSFDPVQVVAGEIVEVAAAR